MHKVSHRVYLKSNDVAVNDLQIKFTKVARR